MENLSRTPHLKLQEMCDCYLETDFSKQLTAMRSSKNTDLMEDGYKYLALALLQATTEQAQKLSFAKEDGSITVTVTKGNQSIDLPAPLPELLEVATGVVRDITHLEGENGKSPLVLGLKNGQLDLLVEIKKDGPKERLTITFQQSEEMAVSEKPSGATINAPPAGEPIHWKCGNCNFTFTASSLPEQCPGCGEKCDFLNITCYTPECGGPGNIDPRLA